MDEHLVAEDMAQAIYDACPLVVGHGPWADATQMTRAMFLKMALAAIAEYEGHW